MEKIGREKRRIRREYGRRGQEYVGNRAEQGGDRGGCRGTGT